MGKDKAIIAKCKQCGNIVAAALDLGYPELGQDILQWVKDGLEVEYVDSPVMICSCTCPKGATQ